MPDNKPRLFTPKNTRMIVEMCVCLLPPSVALKEIYRRLKMGDVWYRIYRTISKNRYEYTAQIVIQRNDGRVAKHNFLNGPSESVRAAKDASAQEYFKIFGVCLWLSW
ncbi:uncharacterized protein isoform X3 [Rhodnius prolixus]